MEHRVKFYSVNDLSISSYFSRMEEIFDLYTEQRKKISGFTDAIELDNTLKIFDSGNYSINWTEGYIDKVSSYENRLKGNIKEFFCRASGELILKYMNLLRDEYEYREDFFEIFCRFNYGSKISENEFEDNFWESGLPLYYLLKDKYFCNVYPKFIKEAFLAKVKHFEYLLSNYTNSTKESYCIPDNISSDEWNELLTDYIHSSEANLNYLRLLLNPIRGLGNKYFKVTRNQKSEIKKISTLFNQSFDKSETGLHVIFEVYYNRKLYKKKIVEYNEKSSFSPPELIDKSIINNIRKAAGEKIDEQLTLYMTSLVDYEKIKNNHDYNDLFTYFLNDSELFSKKKMSSLPSFPNKETLGLAKNVGLSTRNSYKDTQYFQLKQQLASFKIRAYQRLFSEFDLSIEQVVDWFFFQYCDEVKMKWLPFSFSPHDDATDNKTATIFRNEEKIRKQYRLLIEDGKISNEQYNLLDLTPSIGSLPSNILKKYAYIADNSNIQNILFLLFSDQSPITHIDKERTDKTFTKLITNNNVKKEDFLRIDRGGIQFLIDNEILSEKTGKLVFINNKEIDVLQELYMYGEISYFNSNNDERAILDSLSEKGIVEFESSLFSKAEANYLNFLLNNRKFDNSWAIRNKYQHGSPAYESEEQYKFDYSIALLVLVMYIVKINEELVFKNSRT
ncbi:hypothetical protein [Streptococcus mutans]|uniref:hypothetical protein n=1 Tax=Streptococcus mutans TaxID=1309 RepID=UPI0002B5C60C|nr:hypothetical protein [Streptococcus mutans]EMC24552.1 hypothetical protein SMU81_01950 [Streptococcus mutans SF14]